MILRNSLKRYFASRRGTNIHVVKVGNSATLRLRVAHHDFHVLPSPRDTLSLGAVKCLTHLPRQFRPRNTQRLGRRLQIEHNLITGTIKAVANIKHTRIALEGLTHGWSDATEIIDIFRCKHQVNGLTGITNGEIEAYFFGLGHITQPLAQLPRNHSRVNALGDRLHNDLDRVAFGFSGDVRDRGFQCEFGLGVPLLFHRLCCVKQALLHHQRCFKRRALGHFNHGEDEI